MPLLAPDARQATARVNRAARFDALLWFLVTLAVLVAVPIGFVSNDGLGHSGSFLSGSWRVNPNHLFFEALGAWWQSAWLRCGYSGAPVDALRRLSELAGALAVALFRWRVAPRLAGSLWEANHATAWLALSSAFLRLWISDETHMIQMPFVVAVAWLALAQLETPSWRRGLALGAAVGLAALTFISNLLLGATVVLALLIWHRSRREPARVLLQDAAVGLGAALVAGSALVLTWLGSPGHPGLLEWLTSYGGGRQAPRVAIAFGAIHSLGGFAESTVRALYGAASAVVDLGPAAAAVRDRQAPSIAAILGLLAALAAFAALAVGLRVALRSPTQQANRGALLLTASSIVAIVGFGIYWNDSDGQFFFQLAPVFGALAARMTAGEGRWKRLVLTLSLGALLWNAIDVTSRFVLYPRQERVALLEREARGACLVVYPGFDEPELLLALSRPAAATDRLALTDLAIRYPSGKGLRLLTERIERCLASDGKVVLIDVFDTPPDASPWKFLRRLGYDHAAVEAALAPFPLERRSRTAGPFQVRRSASGLD